MVFDRRAPLVHGFLVQDIGNDNVPDALNALTALIREVA